MRIHSVVLQKGINRLNAVVIDDQGHRRGIEVDWNVGGDRTDVPPVGWPSMLLGEVEFQRSEEAAAADGRTLIR